MLDTQGFSNGKAIQIKPFSEGVFLENEETLIALLKENMEINFPETIIDKNYIIETYNKMLRFHKDGSAILIGAFLDGQILGFIWAYQRELLEEKRLHIREIVVQSKARSFGIGEKLLLALENIAKRQGINILDLMCSIHNSRAVKFYYRNGFSPKRYQFEKRLTKRE